MSPSLEYRENREFALEIKFLLNLAVADQIREWARERLSPDPNATGGSGDSYRITSLYFDTDSFDVFHRRGSFGRSKYRIRRYGESEVTFLERKLKARGHLTKRRSIIKLDEMERLATVELERDWTGHWFHRRLLARRLRPVCQIAYERTALVAMTDGGLIRLTLDRDLRAIPGQKLAFRGDESGTRLAENHIILELKFRREMPVLFKQLIERFALNSQAVSKYRLAASSLGLVKEPAREIYPNLTSIVA